MTLYFLRYNNYYNRMVKKEDSLEGYLGYAVGSPLTGCINWNPNDGCDTEQVVNSFTWDTFENPDYVVVVNDSNEIDSRWFVIENTRLRNGQMKLLLHRDVVVDNYQAILEAPMFIEKATPLSTNDPAIYNKENMDFNQIKIGETLLKDETGVPWVVGYIPRDAFLKKDKDGNVVVGDNGIPQYEDKEITANIPKNTSYDVTANTLEELKADYTDLQYDSKEKYFGGTYRRDVEFVIQVKAGMNPKSIVFNRYGLTNTNVTLPGEPTLYMTPDEYNNRANNTVSVYVPAHADTMIEQSYGYTSAHTESKLQDFLSWRNKIAYISTTNKYYKINIETDGYYDNPLIPTISPVWSGNLYETFAQYLGQTAISGTPGENSFGVVSYFTHYYVTFEEIAVNAKVTIGDRAHLEDSPYDMFCIPYGELQIHLGATEGIKTNPSIAIPIAVNIGAQSGSANIYDIQLLPYCPIRSAIKENGDFDISLKSYDEIKDQENNILSYVFWADSSNFTFNIPVQIDGGTTIESRKVINETQMCRLCSPNYSGVFEFNPAKNDGVNYVNVDATYKPYSPYIHINPDFKGLYGSDFNDNRGLILGGDFSLPQITNAWADYQLNNKNYQQMFDREIQNMEVQRDIQRKQQIASMVTGTLGGAAAGGMTGSLIAAGPFAGVGAGFGAALGAAASLGGGIGDLYLSEQLYNENLDYKKDMFGYQLGNIKALPSSLAKTSALTANNKLFPFVEYYSCTDEEVQALKDKLKYNGYSIGRIGKMIDYLQSQPSYIKGQIIRIEGIADDFHGLKAISEELYKGVFV